MVCDGRAPVDQGFCCFGVSVSVYFMASGMGWPRRSNARRWVGVGRASAATAGSVAGREQTLPWDAEGNLASVADGAATTGFLYDADGDRLIRRDPAGTTVYLDGTEVRLDTATGAVSSTRYYLFAGQTVAVRTAAGVQFIAADPHGTGQIAIADKTGAPTRRRMTPSAGRGMAPHLPGRGNAASSAARLTRPPG